MKKKKKQNGNFVIDGIKDEEMFDAMIKELCDLMDRNSLLENIGVSWKRDGRTSSPLIHLC